VILVMSSGLCKECAMVNYGAGGFPILKARAYRTSNVNLENEAPQSVAEICTE